MKNNREGKKGTWKKVLLAILCVFLALILSGMLLVTVYVEGKLGKINRPDHNEETLSSEEIDRIENGTDEIDPDFTGEVVDPEDVTWASEPGEAIGNNENIVNILFIGQDRRPGEGRARSDSMILCTFNKEKRTLTMTSFLRDMYVQIPGHRENRINASYALGGMDLLNTCLATNFGVHVDGNVEVDFSEFEQIIDAMGGVDIELSQKEANWLNLSGWHLKKGVNHLDGEQALAYSRIRYLDSDFGRTNRQRKVLTALVEKSRNLSLSQINSLLDTLLPLITTDMSNNEITGYVLELFPMLAGCSLVNQHIPADGTYRNAYVRGMAVLIPDLEANRKLLKESLAG